MNLEADLLVTGSLDEQVMKDADRYFQRLWNNEGGKFTADYEANKETLTPILKLTYRVQKLTGLTTY